MQHAAESAEIKSAAAGEGSAWVAATVSILEEREEGSEEEDRESQENLSAAEAPIKADRYWLSFSAEWGPARSDSCSAGV